MPRQRLNWRSSATTVSILEPIRSLTFCLVIPHADLHILWMCSVPVPMGLKFCWAKRVKRFRWVLLVLSSGSLNEDGLLYHLTSRHLTLTGNPLQNSPHYSMERPAETEVEGHLRPFASEISLNLGHECLSYTGVHAFSKAIGTLSGVTRRI